jgi:glyoxylase-like metal-dependent hydrolase (beta-lactamase superfamily II)
VFWLRMPLFGALPWINVWALADPEGLTVIDTGIRSPATIPAWEAALSGELANSPVSRVIVTHMHPDHCGTAAWFVERFKARLWMSRLEYLTCRLMADDTGRDVPSDALDFYRAAGWDTEAINGYKAQFGLFGKMIYPLPASYHRLVDGDVLQIGPSEWTVVVGNGHSPEHVCLYSPELKLLISGDQVLPKISSNVSVHPTEPDADPLSDWLDSLARIKSRVPDDVLVLPAHKSPFRGLHGRADELIESHHRGLLRLQELLSQPRRVIDVFGALFARPITGALLHMATGEAIAHLNYLTRRGLASREIDQQGVWWWRA